MKSDFLRMAAIPHRRSEDLNNARRKLQSMRAPEYPHLNVAGPYIQPTKQRHCSRPPAPPALNLLASTLFLAFLPKKSSGEQTSHDDQSSAHERRHHVTERRTLHE